MSFAKFTLIENRKYLPNVAAGIIEDSTKKRSILVRFYVLTGKPPVSSLPRHTRYVEKYIDHSQEAHPTTEFCNFCFC